MQHLYDCLFDFGLPYTNMLFLKRFYIYMVKLMKSDNYSVRYVSFPILHNLYDFTSSSLQTKCLTLPSQHCHCDSFQFKSQLGVTCWDCGNAIEPAQCWRFLGSWDGPRCHHNMYTISLLCTRTLESIQILKLFKSTNHSTTNLHTYTNMQTYTDISKYIRTYMHAYIQQEMHMLQRGQCHTTNDATNSMMW